MLESMVKNILRFLQYDYITTNEIGAGGNELDVVAERRIPSINNIEVYPVICECKAHERPIDMTDWLKFLGKVYKETLRNSRAEGLLIALNDANGNVKGDIRTCTYQNVRLLTAEDLMNVCIQCYSMASILQVQASANFIGQYDPKLGVMIGDKNTNKKEKIMFGIVKHKTGSEEEFLALYY